MSKPTTSMGRAAVAACFAAAVLGGCSQNDLGPSVPTGAVEIGDPTMASAPPPPPGWTLNEDIPQSQQQAQDTVLTYLRRTLSQLPAGTVVDRDGYPGSGGTQWCEDEPEDPDTVPIHVVFTGDLQVPDGMDPTETISAVGETWRDWGWHVFERDGFRKPNQFGYGPDGYRLQIQMPNPATYPPTLIAISPCFPGELAQDDLEFPRVVTQP